MPAVLVKKLHAYEENVQRLVVPHCDGSKSQFRWSSYDHATATYVKNPDFWMPDWDITGRAVYWEYGGTEGVFKLLAVSPRFFICLAPFHINDPVGQIHGFLNREGTVRHDVVADAQTILPNDTGGSLDFTVVRSSTALPDAITPVKYVPIDNAAWLREPPNTGPPWYDYNTYPRPSMITPVFLTTQRLPTGRVCVYESHVWRRPTGSYIEGGTMYGVTGYATAEAVPPRPAKNYQLAIDNSMHYLLDDGDSGSAAWIPPPHGDQPGLLGLTTGVDSYRGGCDGFMVGSIVDKINEAIDDLGGDEDDHFQPISFDGYAEVA